MATEQQVQTGVWAIEMGRGKRVIQWVLLGLAAVALSLVYTAGEFRGLETREAMDLAQLARHIARGEGLTTSVIRPLSLWHLKTHTASHDARLVRHPDLVNPPLYPLVLGGLLRLLPDSVLEPKLNAQVYLPERWVILPFNQICLLLSLLLVYHWANRLFDRQVAITAAWILFLSDILWAYSISGLPTNFLMLLLLATLWLLHKADTDLNPITASPAPAAPAPMTKHAAAAVLVSAVLMGLCVLTSYRTAWLLVPVGIYLLVILRGRRPLLWVAVYLAVVAALIVPWMVRNHAVSNSLFGIARYDIFQGMGVFGGDVLPRSYQPEFHLSARSLAGKFVNGTRYHLFTTLKHTGSDFLIFFFVVGLLYGFRRRDVQRLRGLVVGWLAAGVIALALFGMHETGGDGRVDGGDLLVVLLPVIVVFGTAFFYLLLDRIAFRMRLTRALAIGAFVLVNILPMIFTLLPHNRGQFAYPPYIPPTTRMVANMFQPNEIGCSDLPWSMAWYGDRHTVWLPLTLKDFYEIHDVLPPPGYSLPFLMLTPYFLDQKVQSGILKGEYKEWVFIIRGQVPVLFPLKSIVFLPPNSDQVLLADRPRWTAAGAPAVTPVTPALGGFAQPE